MCRARFGWSIACKKINERKVKRSGTRYCANNSENFDLEKIAIPDQKSWHQYMLGAHIKSCKIELVYAVRIKKMTEEKPAAPAGTPAPQPPPKQESPASKVTYEIKTTKEWKDRNYDQPPDDKKKSQQDEPLLPYLIKMDLVMYDELSARSVPFTLTLPIFSERVYIEPLEGGGRLTDIIKKLADTMLPDQKQKKDGPLMAHAPVPHTINPPISLMPAPAELIPIAQKDSAHATHA